MQGCGSDPQLLRDKTTIKNKTVTKRTKINRKIEKQCKPELNKVLWANIAYKIDDVCEKERTNFRNAKEIKIHRCR